MHPAFGGLKKGRLGGVAALLFKGATNQNAKYSLLCF